MAILRWITSGLFSKGSLPGNVLRKRSSREQGFTLIELLLIVIILGVLVSMLLPSFGKIMDSVRVTRCVVELSKIQIEIEAYFIENDVLPPSLDVLVMNVEEDVYGNPYRYHVIDTNPAIARQNEFFVNLNTSYDLYSVGKDGVTSQVIDDPESLDDIIVAADGGFIGLGADFNIP